MGRPRPEDPRPPPSGVPLFSALPFGPLFPALSVCFTALCPTPAAANGTVKRCGGRYPAVALNGVLLPTFTACTAVPCM